MPGTIGSGIKSIQYGTITLTTTGTATITAVDTAKTILSTLGWSGSECRIALTNTTTITGTSSGSTVVSFCATEYY